MNQSRTLLVVGAHAADFVWRAAGIIAVVTTHGGRASVVALTYGERGESGELWKEPNQTIENVKRIRHEEATRAAEILGATFQCFDLGDYPLQIDAASPGATHHAHSRASPRRDHHPYRTRSVQSRSPAGLCRRPARQYPGQRLGRRQWFPHHQTSRTVPV